MSAVKTIKPLQTTLNNVRAAGHRREPLDLTSQLTSPETWETRANERPVFWSHDHSRPMRGQCPDYVITLPIRGQDPALRSLTTKWETRFKLLFLAYIYKEGERIKMG